MTNVSISKETFLLVQKNILYENIDHIQSTMYMIKGLPDSKFIRILLNKLH